MASIESGEVLSSIGTCHFSETFQEETIAHCSLLCANDCFWLENLPRHHVFLIANSPHIPPRRSTTLLPAPKKAFCMPATTRPVNQSSAHDWMIRSFSDSYSLLRGGRTNNDTDLRAVEGRELLS